MCKVGNDDTSMIREYAETDLEFTAKIWLSSGQDEYYYLPAFQKLNEETAVDVFRREIQDKCSIWIHESGEEINGFMALNNNLIDRLYIDPFYQGPGIGSLFINFAKEIFPDGIHLKTHQLNKRAAVFYEKRGFRAVAFGVSPAPESMPDIEYRWP